MCSGYTFGSDLHARENLQRLIRNGFKTAPQPQSSIFAIATTGQSCVGLSRSILEIFTIWMLVPIFFNRGGCPSQSHVLVPSLLAGELEPN
jgi:hypothetical protein